MSCVSTLRRVVLAVCVVSGIAGAQAVTPPTKLILAVNPIGFLQFGPTAEAEMLPAPNFGMSIGLRVPTLGLVAHAIDPELGAAVLATGALRVYLDPKVAPRRWWIGARGETGSVASAGESYGVSGYGIEVGHRRIFRNRTGVSLGVIAGAFNSESGLTGKFAMGFLMLERSR